ncbi:P-loop containing nucleoside triphosphate hydrolase [Phytophthora cactorum]|nr:P-loop containing nucleoside triphosphate hydrolase [Phytophthora cactorum]
MAVSHGLRRLPSPLLHFAKLSHLSSRWRDSSEEAENGAQFDDLNPPWRSSTTPEHAAQFDAQTAAAIAAAKPGANPRPQSESSTRSQKGVIEEIYCENFMYHRKLRSAIIAAIQICFGASARTTHRGKNIKAFIRHGFDGNALVRVKLRNDDGAGGSDAFHPGKYGKQIIVERLIRRDGSAEYRLKNEQGLLVSKLKSDLDAMMDHLNIQTDNPCAGTSQDKYKFFLQSTDLAKMRTTYTRIDETTRMIAESTLTQEKAKIVTLRDAKNKVKKHGKRRKVCELEWFFVDEKETVAANVENTLKQKERDVVNNAEKLAETKEQGLADRVSKKQQETAQAESDLRDSEADAYTQTNALKELEDRHDGCKDKKTLRLSQAAKANRVAAFGQQLIRTNLYRFTSPPIGPLGMYVTLPDQFMRLSRNYLVVNGQDKALVDKLRRQAHCTSTEANMIITVRTGYRYHNLELPDGGLAGQAICSILQVSNDEVFNALIDTCALESKLLFDDREVAESDKFVVRRGNLAYIANKRDRRGYIISQNVDRGIAELENKLNCLEKKVDELRRDETVLSHDKEELGNAIKQRNDRINDLSRRYNQHRVQLRCLDEEMADALQDHTLDTSVLEGECRSTEDDLQDRLDALEKVETVEKMITAEISERQSDADAVYKRLREAKRELEAAQAAVEKLEQHLVTVRGDCDEQTQIALKLGGKPAEVNPPAHCNKRIQTVERPLARRRSTDKIANFDKMRGNLQRIRSMLDECAISQRTSTEFNKYMLLSNFAGKLRFLH